MANPATLPVANPSDDSDSDQIERLTRDISAIAECDFRADPCVRKRGPFGALHAKLTAALSGLNEALWQMLGFSRDMATVSEEIAERNRELADHTVQQTASIEETSANMERLAATVKTTAKNAESAEYLVQSASNQAELGRDSVARVVTAMHTIEKSSKQVEGIVEVINEIAFQTHMLSLNAAVEAARAGDQGRGFAVVAAEVRNLATRCSDAANEIKGLIAESTQVVASGQTLATEAESKMTEIVSSVRESSDLMAEISAATLKQSEDIQHTNEALTRIELATQQNKDLVDALSTSTHLLDERTKFLTDAVNIFRLRPANQVSHARHQEMQGVAQHVAQGIGKLFERAVKDREITIEALMDRYYQPIANTDPQKYHTRFDAFTDQVLPAVQEPLLQRFPYAVYAGAVDENGYFPTHNLRFCKALTGNYDIDLIGNRTKRIFADRVGATCGTHTERWKLQIYRRDTGELMFDVSSPIFVLGQHWGGFRIGYRLE